MSKPRRQQDMQDMSSQQAQQSKQQIQDSDQKPISEQDGDDLMENQSQDYRKIDALDQYQDEGVDDQQYEYDYKAIKEANQEIGKRHQLMGINQNDDMQDLIFEDEDQSMQRQLRRRKYDHDMIEQDQNMQFDQGRYLDAEQYKGKLPEWIKQQQTVKYIHLQFKKLLTRFKEVDKNFAKYVPAIRNMVISNTQSIQVQFEDIKQNNPTTALWLGIHPNLIIPQLNNVAYKIAVSNYPSYRNMKPQVFVKITNLPFVDNIRDLRYTHLGKLVQIKGVITIRSQVLNQMKKVSYKCIRCGEIKGPYFINQKTQIKFTKCISCQSTGPFLIDKEKTIYRNYQTMTIQESPSEVLPGRIPRTKQALLYGDNVDTARPGDQVEIVGVFENKYDSRLNAKQGFPLFSTMIQVNYIKKQGEGDNNNFDEYRLEEIKKLSKDPNLSEKIYGSIAPSIYGHRNIKRGLTLAMFGGQPVQGVHRVRGDINILLLGDPGIAKSQFLKSVQKISPRAIYTTGKGASAVGLTASVKKDFITNQWKLQAGALVLADKGVCLIDQFDKMNEHDRTSIHEAMEQQSISISKAGIVTSLRARCSVIAAANPRQGRYNSRLSFADNIDLTGPILSRFDVINVVKDEINQELDMNLATFVINSHMQNHPYHYKYYFQNEQYLNDEKKQERKPYIPLQLLRNYIRHARDKIHPQLSEKNNDAIRSFYNELRQASKNYGGMHVSTRQMQSVIRLSLAHAKMHLRTQVERVDVNVGIKVMLESFIQTQKPATAKNIEKQFKKYLQVNS